MNSLKDLIKDNHIRTNILESELNAVLKCITEDAYIELEGERVDVGNSSVRKIFIGRALYNVSTHDGMILEIIKMNENVASDLILERIGKQELRSSQPDFPPVQSNHNRDWGPREFTSFDNQGELADDYAKLLKEVTTTAKFIIGDTVHRGSVNIPKNQAVVMANYFLTLTEIQELLERVK